MIGMNYILNNLYFIVMKQEVPSLQGSSDSWR